MTPRVWVPLWARAGMGSRLVLWVWGVGLRVGFGGGLGVFGRLLGRLVGSLMRLGCRGLIRNGSTSFSGWRTGLPQWLLHPRSGLSLCLGSFPRPETRLPRRLGLLPSCLRSWLLGRS